MVNSTPSYIYDIYRSKDESLTDEAKADMLLALLDTHPEDKDYLLAWVTLLLRYAGKYEACITHAEQTIPGMTNTECIATSYETWSESLKSLGKLEESVKVREQALSFTTSEWSVWSTLSEDYETLEDTENVIKYLELMADDNGDDRQFTKLAELYDAQGDHENAAKNYERLVHQNCDSESWAIGNLGRSLTLAGRHNEAIVQLQFCIFLDPNHANSHYHLAEIYEEKKDIYRALHHYHEALRIKPDFTYIYVRLGALAYNEEGDIKTAIANMEKAIVPNTDKTVVQTIYLNLSRLYDKIKNFDKHEYYKAKWAQSLGFPDGFVGNLGNDDGLT